MQNQFGLLKSKDAELIRKCRQASREQNVCMTVVPEMVSFLLNLQTKDYHVALLDCERVNEQSLQWVRFVRRLRPKVPLVVFCSYLPEQLGAKIYEEKIFYLGLTPVQQETLSQVLRSALNAKVNPC